VQLQFLHRHQEIGGSLNNRQRESQQESIQYDGNLPVVRGTIRDPPVEKGGGAKRANEGILGSKGFLASLRDLQERCYLSLLTHVFMFLHRSPRVDKITGGWNLTHKIHKWPSRYAEFSHWECVYVCQKNCAKKTKRSPRDPLLPAIQPKDKMLVHIKATTSMNTDYHICVGVLS